MRRRILLALVAVVAAGRINAEEAPTGILPLDDAVALALRQHPSLRAAAAVVAAADHGVAAAASGALPQVYGEYGITRRDRSLSALIQGPAAERGTLVIKGANPQQVPIEITLDQETHFNFQEAGFSLRQLLFDFGRTLNLWHAALADAASSRADSAATRQEVIFNVKRSYYDLIAAKRLAVVADESQAQTERHLEEAKRRYEAGTAPRYDVTREEVHVANAELVTLMAHNTVAIGRENLREAIGQTSPILFEPDDRALDFDRSRSADFVEAVVIQQAMTRRPELQRVVALKRAASERLAALEKDYLPSASGAADYSFTGNDAPSDAGWSIGAVVRMNIFNGGLTPAQIGQQRAELSRLSAMESQERQRVELDVRRSLLNLRRSEDAIHAATTSLGAAEENYRIAERRYSAGVSSILELNDAQVARSVAQATMVHVLADCQTGLAQLEHAIGAPPGGG